LTAAATGAGPSEESCLGAAVWPSLLA